MSVAIIQSRLLDYNPQTIIEQENALKEIIQEIALMVLSRNDFFRMAAFQGGTCLRILYGLERFSEDLDFILEASDKNFQWDKYLQNMQEEFKAYGFNLELKDRSKLDNAIKMTFLKADSMGGVLILKDMQSNKPQLRIKLEIDANPPTGSEYELKYLDFPLSYSIKTQNLPSLFASKCHALLCREYIKGRDWYDFIWYVARKTPINFTLLKNAINQVGPWEHEDVNVTPQWLGQTLNAKITEIDWDKAKQDVARFLKPNDLISLGVWSQDFFHSRLEKLIEYLKLEP